MTYLSPEEAARKALADSLFDATFKAKEVPKKVEETVASKPTASTETFQSIFEATLATKMQLEGSKVQEDLDERKKLLDQISGIESSIKISDLLR